MDKAWIALIVTVIVAVGVMVVVGDDSVCGTYTTKSCGPGDLPQRHPPVPPGMR